MTIVSSKPSYWITVRDNYWCFLESEDGAARLYENTVYQSPVVKSIGITGTVAEGNIYASGIVYDYTRQVQGAEIALDAVALDHFLVDKATGATTDGGFVYDSSNDIGKEFAFGYYIEQRNGEYVYYWHPRCLLTANDETVETSTDSAVDPTRSFTIRALPTAEGFWRIRYNTEGQVSPLTPAQFFGVARYTNKTQAAGIALSDTVKVGTAVTTTITYVDGATPTTPTIAYSWWISATEDGEYTQIASADTSSYTPAAGDATKYIKCVAEISGSAIGYVETDPKVVASS